MCCFKIKQRWRQRHIDFISFQHLNYFDSKCLKRLLFLHCDIYLKVMVSLIPLRQTDIPLFDPVGINHNLIQPLRLSYFIQVI